MYFRYTVIFFTVSYQYCSYSYNHDIHERKCIYSYCLLTYDNSVIFIMFYFKLSRGFFLTNVELVHLYYFQTQCIP